MVNVVARANELAAEITIEDNTATGAASVTQTFARVGASADEAADSTKKLGEAAEGASRRSRTASDSAERALARLEKSYEPLVRVEQKRTRALEDLNRVRAQGAVGDERYAELQRRITDHYDRQADRIRAAERAQDGLNRTTGRMEAVFGKLKAAALGFFAAFSVAAAVGFFRDLVRGANDAIASLDELAKKARSVGGIGEAGFLQEARFALGNQGIEGDAADKALQRLSRNVGDLKLGQGTLTTTLQRLDGGAELAESLRNAGSLRRQYELVVDALGKIPDAATRAALATAAFGKEAGANIGAIAEGGVEEFRKLSKEARDAGIVIEADLLERAEVLNDRLANAGKIVSASLTKALLSLGPILADLAEAAAAFLKKLIDGVDALINRTRNIEKTSEIAELRGIARTAAADAARIRAEARGNITSSTPASLAADIIARGGREAQKALDRHAAAVSRINELYKEQGLSVLEIAGLTEKAAAATEEASGSLADLVKARDEAVKRLGAAQGGRDALDAFDRSAEIDKIVEATGLTGDLADEARRVVEETLRADESANRLAKSFGEAARAASKVKIDPLADLAADEQRLRDLLEAARLGPEEYELATRRLEIEDRIARIKVEASRASIELDQAAVRERLQSIETLQRELDDLTASRPETDAARFAEGYRRELFAVADDFVQRLARGDLSSFRDFARSLKDILLTSIVQPFSNAFANAVAGALGGIGAPGGVGFGGGLGIFTPGIGGGASPASGGRVGLPFGGFSPASLAQAAIGIGGLSLGGASSVFGLASLIGPGAIGRGVASIGNFLGLGGGTTDFLAGGLAKAGTLGGAIGGIGGSLLSGALFGKSKAQSIGSTIGGIAGNFIPIPVLGPLIGSFLGGAIGSLFGGKPSNKFARGLFDPATGAISSLQQKDNSQKTAENVKARDEFLAAISESIRQVAALTGGSIAKTLAVEINSREGIKIGFGGFTAKGGPIGETVFKDPEAALKFAFDRLVASLSGGDEALVGVAKALSASGKSIEDVVGRLEKLKAVIDVDDTPVDEFKQRLETLIEAFDGLDRSTGALKQAFDTAVDRLAASANEINQKALDAILNPAKAALVEQLDALDARRAALTEINAEGGNVDLTLFDRLARSQILNGFNIDRRLAAGEDPARASIEAFRETQRQELEALKAAVGRFGVTQDDVAALLRAQAFERRAFFETIPAEDRARLAGVAGDFDSLEGRYGRAVEKLLEETERLVDGFEDRADALRDIIDDRTQTVDTFNRALFDLERRFGQGDPAQRLGRQRSIVEDLQSRALVAEDTADRRLAREQLPQAVADLVQFSQSVNASSAEAQGDLAFGRGVLERVRDAAAKEKTEAEKQLATLEASRAILEEIRDLLAAPRLDAPAVLAAALRLDPAFDNREAVISFADDLIAIQEAMAAQNERIAAALEAIAPEDIGLTAPSALPGAAASPLPPAPVAPAPSTPAQAPTTAPAGGGSTAPSAEADLTTQLYQIVKRLESIYEQDRVYYGDQRRRDERADSKLQRIASAA